MRDAQVVDQKPHRVTRPPRIGEYKIRELTFSQYNNNNNNITGTVSTRRQEVGL